jgi:hypothetical protein
MYSRMNEPTIATKKCRVCQIEKPLDEFYADARAVDKHRSDCATCNCKSRIQWQKNNRDAVREKNREWHKKNKEHVLEWKKNYAPRKREMANKRYHENPETRQRIIESVKLYRRDPKNRPVIIATRRRLTAEYRKNPLWRLRNNLRRRLLHVLHGNRKAECTMKLVGCTWEQLRLHIQSKFTEGMGWDNYGKWHVDHIKPCNSFDLSKPDEQRKCFNYTNLQPLWAFDNLSKGDWWLEE